MNIPSRTQARCFFSLLLFLAVASGYADTVSALGRVHPVSGVLNLFAEPGQVVSRVFVQEGEWVEAGQVLAHLASHSDLLEDEQSARANLQAVKERESIKTAMLRAEIRGLEKEVAIARSQFQRIASSDAAQFAAPDMLDQKQLILVQAEAALSIAREKEKLRAVETEQAIRDAESQHRQALRAFQRSEIRAPLRAKILKQFATPGFSTDRGELFKIGNTESMRVVAEVYESDVHRVAPGNSASITSSALTQPVQGRVVQIGSMIFQDSVDSLDPTALTNARVVEVVILIDDPAALENLVYLQVDVEIQI